MQASVLKVWEGKDENVAKAQAELITRAKANGLAAVGKYQGGLDSAAGGQSLFVAQHAY
uniref:fructose-bisphosphate aldolase n=1 Tax=Magallana gigas TaxID=29159 RepID=A0A8W8MJM6_MAGGI